MILRVAIVVGAGAAILGSRAAGDAGTTGFTLLAAVILLSAAATAAEPDSHLGLVTSLLIGAHWWASVDDVTTPWTMLVAGALIVLHTAAAAAAAAPLGSRWPGPMRARWLRRLAIAAGIVVPMWALVGLVDRIRVPASSPLVAAALAVVALAAWSAQVIVGRRS